MNTSTHHLFRSYDIKSFRQQIYDGEFFDLIPSDASLLAVTRIPQQLASRHDEEATDDLIILNLETCEILSSGIVHGHRHSSDQLIALGNSKPTSRFIQETDEILSFVVIKHFNALAVGFSSGKVILYKLISSDNDSNTQKHKKFRIWALPSPCISMHICDHLLACGMGNGAIRLYNLSTSSIEYDLVNHTGRVHFLRLVKTSNNNFYLFSGAMDGLKVWNLSQSTPEPVQLVKATIVDLKLIDDDEFALVTGDRKIHIFNLKSMTKTRDIPIFDSIVQIQCLNSEHFPFAQNSTKNIIFTFSSEGIIRAFDAKSGDLLLSSPEDDYQAQHSYAYYSTFKKAFVVGCENSDILLYSNDTLSRVKQIVGFNDEVIDAIPIPETDLIAVATSGEKILIIDRKTKNTEFLTGHMDSILGLASGIIGNIPILISCSKDKTVRVWNTNTKACLAICDTHTESVTSIAWASNNGYFVSVAEDKVMKVYPLKQVKSQVKKWKNNPIPEKEILVLDNQTRMVHEKAVNDVDISPNGQLIATASYDKTVKIWNSSDCNLVDSFEHRKGVWTVRFSPVEKCIATGCADNMIRIFSLTTHACLKVLEGHSHPILKLSFVNRGSQIISSSSIGIFKLWNIKSAECLQTFDPHSERVWTIVTSNDGAQLMTAGEDGRILFWKENTKSASLESKKLTDELTLKDQRIKNLLRRKEFGEAILHSLDLDQPRRTFELFEQLLSHEDMNVETVINKLSYNQVTRLFEYSVDWNTNSKFSSVAQHILHAMFRVLDPKFISWNYEKAIDSLLAYSNKHTKRVDHLLESTYLLDYTIHQMNQFVSEEDTKYDDDQLQPSKSNRIIIEDDDDMVEDEAPSTTLKQEPNDANSGKQEDKSSRKRKKDKHRSKQKKKKQRLD